MDNKEKTQTIINQLIDQLSYNELEKFFLQKSEGEYILESVLNDNLHDENILSLKKYILKSLNKNEVFRAIDLKPESRLFKDLANIIYESLGGDYIFVTVKDVGDSYYQEPKNEVFNRLFRKTFLKNKSGYIKAKKTENCLRIETIGELKELKSNVCTIGVDTTFKNNLIYTGHQFKNESILFYGNNIEENKYLLKLFESYPPKKILNIIPIGESQFIVDNVD